MQKGYLLLLMCTVSLLVVTGAGSARCESLDHVLTFNIGDLVLSSYEGYDKIYLEGEDLTFTPGRPELPVHLFHLALPGRAIVESVTLEEADWTALPGTFRVAPVQQPFILSSDLLGIPMPERVDPDPAVYDSDGWYPAQAVKPAGDGFMAGVHLAALRFYPVRYAPLSGTLEFCERAVLRVHYSLSGSGEFRTATLLDRQAVRGRAIELAANVDAADQMEIKVLRPYLPVKDEEAYDYLLVTAEEFAAAFQSLVHWKTRKGVRVKVVTMEEINVDYAGIEPEQARVRQCIIDAYANWGITWVLLGADTDWVPSRTTWAMNAGMGPFNNTIHADLYYADLDGDWNANGEEPYGEVEDNVDLYSDVYVGRLPVRTAIQAERAANKILTYVKSPPMDYQTDMLMTGEVLWNDPYTDSGVGLNWIDETCVPPRFDPVQKLYESLGNESKTAVMNALNQGKNFWIHDGHGNSNLLSVGYGVLYTTDMPDLDTEPRWSIAHSIACLPAAFQTETSIAEKFVRVPGGGIAFVGNNNFGWGSPGNPKFGYSDRMQHKFFDILFNDGVYRLGEILALVKAEYVPQSQGENVYRWHQYEITLLGEPEFSVWTRTPAVLDVDHADSHPLGDGPFTVTVTEAGAPLEGAQICVTDDAGVYELASTGPTGQATFIVNPAAPGSLWVTVTAPDFLPYEGGAEILPSGPYAVIESFVLDDSERGNGNGLLNSGESVDLVLTLCNPGTETALSVFGHLTTGDPLVEITDGADAFGDIGSGQSATCEGEYAFEVDPGAGFGHVCLFAFEITSASGGPWPGVLAIPVSAPVIRVASLAVDDVVGGDGDFRIEPGESFDLFSTLRNLGTDVAAGAAVEAWTPSPHVEFGESTFVLGDVPAGENRTAEFSATVAPGCPDPHFPMIHFQVTTTNGYAFQDSSLFVVGTTGFDDDMEGGDANWSHGGTNDHWHLTSDRTHSGASAWYCGRPDTGAYVPDMSAQLATAYVTLAPEPRVSMWLWHDLPTYGSDGLYVIVHQGALYDTLDFIASGGALGLLNIGNDWLEFTYDLGYFGYQAEDEVQLMLSFFSDGNATVAEGFYVDDVVVTGTLPSGFTGVWGGDHDTVVSTGVTGNRPNPFNPRTDILFRLAVAGPVELAIYDISGRRVATLVQRAMEPGCHSAAWDGTDSNGAPVASGVYFARLIAHDHDSARKIVLLK
ncbi:MAG: hypothetical protein KAW17_08300 [Candidatus Eisenbacteria sp.]|nr:hypothetical protein [Candidatus Eisenbacteria bacterium]